MTGGKSGERASQRGETGEKSGETGGQSEEAIAAWEESVLPTKLRTDARGNMVRILVAIGLDSKITTEGMCTRTGMSASGVAKVLSELKKMGVIFRDGPDYGGSWHLGDRKKTMSLAAGRGVRRAMRKPTGFSARGGVVPGPLEIVVPSCPSCLLN